MTCKPNGMPALTAGRPQRISDTMAFMFETRSLIRPTAWALQSAQLQSDYAQCWAGLPRNFAPPR